MCGSATQRAGRKDSRPLSAGAGRAWRRRGTVGGCPRTFLLRGRGSSCSSQISSHPGTRRHSAASAAAVAAPRHKHQTSGGGDASPVRWELPEASVGALARRLFSGPQAAQLTRPEDENGRHALCVSRNFHSGRDSWASGKGKLASTLSAGAVGGLACAPPRVGALRGRDSAPYWWRLVLTVISAHTPTLGPVRWLKR